MRQKKEPTRVQCKSRDMEVLAIFEEVVEVLVDYTHDFLSKLRCNACLLLSEIEQLTKRGADCEVEYIHIGRIGLCRFKRPKRPN